MTNPGKCPNFLYLITDQHRADWLGCYGHPVVRTPNIDAIAARGVRFDNFHVASPVCMPNRASLMTGRMPSVHGLRYNGCALPYRANTFVDVLRAAGYDTAIIGKSHLQPFSALPPRYSDEAPASPQPVPDAWKPTAEDYHNEGPDRYADADPYALPKPYYGYDHVEMVTRHGDRTGGHYEQWLRENADDFRALWDPANELPHDYTCPQAYRTPVPEHLYPTTWIADRAINFIKGREGEDAPFFSFVSFPDPHHPFNPPGKYWDIYDSDDFELSLPYDAHQNPTPALKWLKDHFEETGQPVHPFMVNYADDRAVREAMALTAGMITMIDDQIGRIIAALKESGEYENTVVVFNTDHGDYLGDFNMLFKGPMPSRAITRVPFIWSDPTDRCHQTRDVLASTIDIPATILDRAGLAPFHGIQGKSLLPSLTEGAPNRDELLIEHNESVADFGFRVPPRVRCLVTERWRYTLYAGEDWGELYDLNADPFETVNLWDAPDYAQDRARLAERLAVHLTAQMDENPRATRVA